MSFLFDPLPHTEATARIATLPLFQREMFDELLPELKAYAFTITGLDSFDQLARARDLLAAVPAGEKTWDKAKKEIAAEIGGALGGKEAQARSELLLRTHTFRAYAVSRYRTLMAQRDVFPFWQYKTHGDGRVRPSHAALGGKIFPAGHPIWQRIFPPWDWGCRCLVVPMMGSEVIKLKDGEQDKAPEAKRVYDGDLADAIHTAERLPAGESLLTSNTWGASPWSEPGTVQHTWKLIQDRYKDQPEVLGAFEQWAKKTEIPEQGRTVWSWVAGARVKAKALNPEKPTVATRRLEDIEVSVGTLSAQQAAVEQELVTHTEALRALVSENAAARVVFAQFPPGSVRAMEVLSEVDPAIASALARMQDSVRRSNDLAERGREAISIPVTSRGAVKLIDAAGRRNVAEGAGIVERYTHPDLLPVVKVVSTRKRRAFHTRRAGESSIHINAGTTPSTVAHEITHATEQASPERLQAARDFLLQRASGERALPLRRLAPRAKYDADEMAFEDEWVKRGGNVYAGKDYPAGRATEILTMGIERLHRDPLRFFRDDPDYFRFVLRTLQKLES